MKKTGLFLLLFLLGCYASAEKYVVIQKSDGGRNFVFSSIKGENGKVKAEFCLVNPGSFHFFSMDSDPDLFPGIEENISILSERKDKGRPKAAILVDFSHQVKIKKSFNIRYLCNCLGILMFAPPYIKKVNILNPNKLSKRFFVETKINDKDYYGVMVLDSLCDIKGVKKLLREVDGVGRLGMITSVLEDFSIKLTSFENGAPSVVYESEKNHRGYTCIFLASEIN